MRLPFSHAWPALLLAFTLSTAHGAAEHELIRLASETRKPAATELKSITAAEEAASVSIAVIYPESVEPYRRVFSKIIEGIEDVTKSRLRSFRVGANVDVADLQAQLKRSEVRVVIALGHQGYSVASGMGGDIPLVVGCALAFPDKENQNLHGISLAPDPTLLFARLKNLQPGVKRVLVIYDPQQNGWLIKLAREAAKVHGLELVAQEARSLPAAARLYEAVMSSADPRRDAVWLPQDSVTVDENAILPLVLKASWDRNVTVFSSRISDVRRGVLFALYPNHREMGRSLAISALEALSGEPRVGLMPLRDVETAFNTRTASHIGLNLSSDQKQMFDSIFPER